MGRPYGKKIDGFVMLLQAAYEPSPSHGARGEGEGISKICVERG
ncbi:MAG TPA: hypothetical protein VKR57_10555 [Terriglobales bacterium]|jgi:hypothetical protein|nr:hypothetical protein [Terriglobales bacterium]